MTEIIDNAIISSDQHDHLTLDMSHEITYDSNQQTLVPDDLHTNRIGGRYSNLKYENDFVAPEDNPPAQG